MVACHVHGRGEASSGAPFVFDLDGKVRHDLTIRGLLRPNNVDVAYGTPDGRGVVCRREHTANHAPHLTRRTGQLNLVGCQSLTHS